MAILLSIFYFFYFSIVGVYIIFLPKVIADFGYSALEVGVIFASGPLVRFILPFLFMRGLELNNKVFNLALLIMALSSVAFYFSIDNFYKLLTSNIFLSLGLGLILPYVEVISLSTLGKERYGKIRLFGSIGFVLVALVLVKILNSYTVALNFLLTLTFITALVAFVISKVASKNKEHESKNEINDINLFADYKLWLGLILMQMSFGSYYNFYTIYATNNGIPLDMTIYLWSFGVFAEIIMLYFQGHFLKKSLLRILEFTTFMTAIRWLLLFVFAQNIYVQFFAQSIHALSFALFHSAAISYLYVLYKHKSLAQQFFSGITYGLGGLSGALIAGYIYEYYPTYLFLSSAVMAFGAFWFLYLWGREIRFLGKAQKS